MGRIESQFESQTIWLITGKSSYRSFRSALWSLSRPLQNIFVYRGEKSLRSFSVLRFGLEKGTKRSATSSNIKIVVVGGKSKERNPMKVSTKKLRRHT